MAIQSVITKNKRGFVSESGAFFPYSQGDSISHASAKRKAIRDELNGRMLEIGARNSQMDMKRIQEIHDMTAELGAACHEPKGVLAGMGMMEAEIPMPEAWKDASAKGKSCYQKLRAKGHSEESAIAICRASLNESEQPAQEAMPAKYQGIDFTPPEAVQKAAMRGLAMRRKYGRGGLTTQQAGEHGIGSGVARATTLAKGTAVSPEVIRQMVAFFARHEKNLDTPPEEGNGMIAGLLWGGRPGMAWANKVKGQMDAADKKAEAVLRHLEAVSFKSLPVRSKRAYFAKLGSGKTKGTLYKQDPKTGKRVGPGKKKDDKTSKGASSGGGGGSGGAEARFENARRIGSEDDANKAFEGQTEELYGKATFQEQHAIRDYSGDNYEFINGELRAGTCCSRPEIQRSVDGLDSVLNKSSMPSDTILYRGITSQTLSDQFRAGGIGAGDVFQDSAFMSTSASAGVANKFGNQYNKKSVAMEILAPKGTRGAYIESFTQNPGEAEFLLPRGSKLRIVSVDTSGLAVKVRAEVINE